MKAKSKKRGRLETGKDKFVGTRMPLALIGAIDAWAKEHADGFRSAVRLSEAPHERLQLATERPGVGKSMMIDDALDRFLDHVPSIEDLVGERFDEMRVRFDRLERNMQMMAETVSLHARYHLALMPVLPQSRQHEASRIYDRYSRGLVAPSA